MVAVTAPEWLMWTVLGLMLAQAVLQIVLAVLKVKIERATKELDATYRRFFDRFGTGD